MALTTDRMIKRREGVLHSDPVAAGAKIYAGALVCLDASGNAVPGSAATTLTARGIAQDQVDNTSGASGDQLVSTRSGVHNFNNSAAADAITRAEIGDTCYIVDDETVAKTNGSSSRSVAGVVVDVGSDGVWVRVGI